MLNLESSFENRPLGDVLVDLAVRFVLNTPTEDLETSERLFFQIEEAHWFFEDFVRVDNPALPSMKLRTFVERLFEACPLLLQYSPDPMSAFATFQSYKSVIPVRGGIILNAKMNKVLMVKGWKSGSSWSFPKGKINKDEPDVDCAVREVDEETGFDMTPYIVKDDFLEIVRQGKNIRLYIVRGVPMDTVFETRTRKEISKIEWHDVNSLPVFNKNANSTSTKYYMATPFMNGLKKYIAKSRGLATSLSSQETTALKNVLGGTSGAVENDEEAAKRLLALLQGPAGPNVPPPMLPQYNIADPSIVMATPAMPHIDPAVSFGAGFLPHAGPMSTTNGSDRQILLDLIKGGNKTQENQLESAKEILGLLRNEIDTEAVLNQPSTLSVPPKPVSESNKTAPEVPPAVPTNTMLESLISSRKEAAKSGQAGNSLLSLLRGDSAVKPPAVKPTEPSSAKDGSYLLSLLHNNQRPVEEPSIPAASSSNRLLSLLSNPESEAKIEPPKADVSNGGNELMKLLNATPPQKTAQAPAVSSSTSNSLMSLLRPSAPKETPVSNPIAEVLASSDIPQVATNDQPVNASTPSTVAGPTSHGRSAGNSLLSLLSRENTPTSEEKPAGDVKQNGSNKESAPPQVPSKVPGEPIDNSGKAAAPETVQQQQEPKVNGLMALLQGGRNRTETVENKPLAQQTGLSSLKGVPGVISGQIVQKALQGDRSSERSRNVVDRQAAKSNSDIHLLKLLQEETSETSETAGPIISETKPSFTYPSDSDLLEFLRKGLGN